MSLVFIVSRNAYDQKRIRNEISENQVFTETPRFHFGHPDNIHQDLRDSIKLLIYQSGIIGNELKDFPLICRKLGYEGPLLVLCPALPETMKDLAMDGVVYIDNPFEKQNLCGVARNMLQQEGESQRKFRRFDICEHVRLEGYESQFEENATILNISRGGLYLRGPFSKLKPGDLIRIHFDLDKINKKRSMSARVAWVEKEPVGGKDLAMGVEFVSQLVVYNYLLKYAT